MMHFIKIISRLFDSKLTNSNDNVTATALSRVLASLLYEAARVDTNVTHEDLEMAVESLQNLISISKTEAGQLLIDASQLHNRPTAYHPLTKIINEEFSYRQKCELIKSMWSVAHSDNHVDPQEDHIIRKISDLLYVAHQDFIYAKINARDSKKRKSITPTGLTE
ncbi:MAG: TerB family tellurite resistance protein [Proteobacteria bacterium]|nr:TerB family tellurite resistance protein [Pseudomonadota bacterium]MDA1331300.1 TerB family tellurite resistance protein [Pseudomonadota bacterium]